MSAFRTAFAEGDARKLVEKRDESGERVVSGRMALGRSAISEASLQRLVAQDLEMLLNTVAFESSTDIEEFGHVRKSILNFGLPDIVHRSIDESSVADVGGEIRAALINYEPRLIDDSIEIRRDIDADVTALKVRFVVKGDLNCDPVNLPVEFVAEVERQTGNLKIQRR